MPTARVAALPVTKFMDVKVFIQKDGRQLVMLIADFPHKGKKHREVFFMDTDVAEAFGRRVSTAGRQAREWNTAKVVA